MRKTGADPERGDRSTRKFSMRLRLQCQSIIEDVRVLALVPHPRIALATKGSLVWGDSEATSSSILQHNILRHVMQN